MAANQSTATGPSAIPETRREELVETLHGHEVADPYRWLEAPATDPELKEWVTAQAAASEAHLGALPARGAFRDHLGQLWNHARRSAPWRRGDRWFQLANDGTQDQDVLWSAAAPEGEPRSALPADDAWTVLIDPHDWSEDGTASLTGFAVTDDGARAAFARSDAGSDWMVWQVIETATGEVLPDEVRWSKFSTAAWLPDGRGFLYCAYDPPEQDQEFAAANRDQQVRLHVVGTDPAADALVHARPDEPEWGFHPVISHDGRWLILVITHGTRPTNRVHVAAIDDDGQIGEVRPLLDEGDARYEPLGEFGGELLVVTDKDAPFGRVVSIDLDSGDIQRELIPTGPDRLEDAQLVGGFTPDEPAWLVARTLHHATSRLTVHAVVPDDGRDGAEGPEDTDTSTDAEASKGAEDASPTTATTAEAATASVADAGEVALPGVGTVTAVSGGRRDTSVHLTFETFTGPAAVLRIDLDATAPSSTVAPFSTIEVTPPSAPVADHLEVQQVHVNHDGVSIPLFLIHRRDITPDGTIPTVLWGYGGFDIPVTPMYRPGWRAWVDAGGLLAVACLRGGGEYGRAWHDDGRLGNKEHVFDDALACAAWLAGRRRDEVTASALTDGADADAVWSAADRIGIEGRSNGGLLAGACLTREPGAFGTAVPEVGVLDMLRFHLFTIGWAWISDYGSPDEAEDLEVLLRYSPYHRIEQGRDYPATLITTGDTDDRVVPAHSYKFAAALQRAQGGEAPVLLRVDIAAGHGAGKPISKLLDERADVLAFHAHHLGLTVNGLATTG